MSEREFVGVARLIGSVPNTGAPLFVQGDIELYQLDPPLCGYHVVAAAKKLWAVRVHAPPEPPEDPVSTALYGVTGGEDLQILWGQKLPGSADGRYPARALADAGYALL
jgi:hypothetical protein